MAAAGLRERNQSDVGRLFFSDPNVELLQERMRVGVRDATGLRIGRQSDDELTVVMRSIFLTECAHLPDRVREQVVDLNAKVLEYCVENIVNELEMRGKFIRDLTQPREVMPHSINANVKGHRSLGGMIR